MPGGPYIPGHKQGAPQSFRKFIRYGACMSSHGRVESNGVDIRRQFEGRTAEGGGEQDIGSGLGVGPVYAAHHIRSFQTELGRIDPGGACPGPAAWCRWHRPQTTAFFLSASVGLYSRHHSLEYSRYIFPANFSKGIAGIFKRKFIWRLAYPLRLRLPSSARGQGMPHNKSGIKPSEGQKTEAPSPVPPVY